jgi:ABC-2 type transport system permease protein
LFFMVMYPAMAKEMDLFLKILESFPKEVLQAIGLSSISFGGTIGFYSFVMTYVLLAGSVQAMNLGVASLSAEVRDKTADFLYTKPVSRPQIINSKMLAVLVQLLLTSLVYGLFSWLILVAVNRSVSSADLDFRLFLLLTAPLAWLQLFFASLGLCASVFLKRIRTVLPISMGVVFFFYVLFVLNQTLKNAELAFLTPFNYFELNKILLDGAYEAKYVFTMAVLVALLVSIAHLACQKKDLPSI